MIDDHSRLAYSEVLDDEKGPTCAAFLERALDYFAAHGISRVERLMTDNAWAYRWSLRKVCAEHDITATVEVIDAGQVGDYYDKVVAGDVRYRAVIDTATLAD